MKDLNRREFLAYTVGIMNAAVLSGVLLGGTLNEHKKKPAQTAAIARPPRVTQRPQFEIQKSETYSHIQTIGDLTEDKLVCLLPPNRNDKEAMEKFREEQERYFITTRSSFHNQGKIPSTKLYFLEYTAHYNGDNGKRQIMGVSDLRGIEGISDAYNSHEPLGHLIRYTAATGSLPMHVYLTETAAYDLEKSAIFRQNLMGNFSPNLGATVLSNDSEQSKLIRGEPCKTGIHEFFPEEDPIHRFKFSPPNFTPLD